MSKIAVQHPIFQAMAILPDGQNVTKEQAKAAGFTLSETGAPAVQASSEDVLTEWQLRKAAAKSQGQRGEAAAGPIVLPNGRTLTAADQDAQIEHKLWEHAILSSPEGQRCPAAARRIVDRQTPATMNAELARATLRGLDAETGEVDPAAAAPVDPRAARLSELRISAAHFNQSRGCATEDDRRVMREASARVRAGAVASISQPRERTVEEKEARLEEIRRNGAAFNANRRRAGTA